MPVPSAMVTSSRAYQPPRLTSNFFPSQMKSMLSFSCHSSPPSAPTNHLCSIQADEQVDRILALSELFRLSETLQPTGWMPTLLPFNMPDWALTSFKTLPLWDVFQIINSSHANKLFGIQPGCKLEAADP